MIAEVRRPHDLAAAQVEQLNDSRSMNDRYRVNAQTLESPFGEFVGDVIWLSIKRRDKAPVTTGATCR